MKSKFNKTWLIISSVIILNIIIFTFLSNKLESIVINDIQKKSQIESDF